MKIKLINSSLVFAKKEKIQITTVEGITFNSSSISVSAWEESTYYFPVISGRKYRIVVTPASEQPVIKRCFTPNIIAIGGTFNDYQSGGGVSKPSTYEYTASTSGYYNISLVAAMMGSITVEDIT